MDNTQIRKKVLVIEDDDYVQEFITCLLETKKYEVITVDDGLKAFEIIEKEIPDIIFLDIMLPKIDGLQTYKRLRDNPKTKDIPIILMSSADKERILSGLNIQNGCFISKPFDSTELLNQVETLLNMERKRYE